MLHKKKQRLRFIDLVLWASSTQFTV